MSWWEERVLPRLVEVTLSSGTVSRLRAEACAGLRGHVVEIGFGSGMNLPHYPRSVDLVSAVEPNDRAWEMAQARVAAARSQVRRVGLDGERLPVPDGSADAVLLTFVLCTIPRPEAAVAEMRRVLGPGGTVHFVEHGTSPDPGVARWQRRLEPLQRRVAGGCHLTRDPVALLQGAGLEVREDRRGYLPGPGLTRFGTYVYRGVAVR